MLELVPGLIITQHSGAGKANQYFLRGFNLDHGTDFLTTLDGVPLNLRTHAHGQGYTDLNFLIPELVQRVQYFKGPYFAVQGRLRLRGRGGHPLRRRAAEEPRRADRRLLPLRPRAVRRLAGALGGKLLYASSSSTTTAPGSTPTTTAG